MSVEPIINKIVNALSTIKGIEAIVLGGSRARGNFTPKSDIDIGVYYNADLDLDHLRAVATALDDSHRPNLITEIGEWEPWINGGGWLTVENMPTDILLRDIAKVARVIDDCLQGQITIDYQPGHPHGFINVIYAAETYYCRLLWAKTGAIAKLKEKLSPYPVALQQGIVNKFLWEASFTLIFARKSIARQDACYAAGCFYRIAACLVQVLYALNKTFLMNENGALDNIDYLPILPHNFRQRITGLFDALKSQPQALAALIDKLAVLVKEVEDLAHAGCGWRPYY